MTDEIVVEAPIHRIKLPIEFWAAMRLEFGRFDQVQVDTIQGILRAARHWPPSWVAYGLATAWHEARLKPIEEIGKGRGKPYGVPHKYRQAPYGRGLVQLTHDFNYEWADEECAKAGLIEAGEILRDFDLVMRPDIASFILVKGMQTGAFTGRGLGRYLPCDVGVREQFVKARRIINGTDRDEKVAGYALDFQTALEMGGWA